MRTWFWIMSGLLLAAPVPPQAAAAPPVVDGVRYHLVFDEEFDDPAAVAEAPPRQGARWFRTAFFGQPTTPGTSVRVSGGILTLQGQGNRPATIVTAGPAAGDPGWSGTVFRGGAYIEARIAVGAHEQSSGSAWPSFFGMSIEHLAQRGAAAWAGRRADVMRYIEDDLFEYDPRQGTGSYAASLHEWFGRWGIDCGPGNFCNAMRNRQLPVSDGFQEFHIVGQLWVPATPTSNGSVQNFLDGRAVGTPIGWRYGDPPTYPASGAFQFNVIDRHGLALVLSTGGLPMRVDWVRVWQGATGRVERR